jgi:tetratricopeptide (TPR) repeat protein
MSEARTSTNVQQGAKQAVTLNFEAETVTWVSLLTTWLSKRYLSVFLLLTLTGGLYFVFVKLPGTVAPSAKVDSESFIREEINKPIDVSPWQETQLAKYRKEAQNILSKVLDKQQLLEDKQVKTWAGAAYKQAIEQAATGDVFYRDRKFDIALQTYQLALQQLEALESDIDSQFSLQLSQGQQALDRHDATQAIAQLSLALALKPDHIKAEQALQRSQVLDQVLALVKSGVVSVNEQQLEIAKSKFDQAHKLDPYSELVKQHVKQVNETIKEENYSLAMSQGYIRLNQQQYNQAIVAFGQAKNLKPAALDPQKAMLETNNKQTQFAISKKINLATKEEQQESWLAAQSLYMEALQLDNTLVSARVGKIRSKARLTLDKAIVNILNKPNRLTYDSVFTQAQGTYNEAMKIQLPGQKLKQQIAKLSTLFSQLARPVSLQIESDNQTKIHLYRVGELGNFTSKQLVLKPGEYTLLGSRDGYRDVRQQVKLLPNSQGNTVMISCREKVSNG